MIATQRLTGLSGPISIQREIKQRDRPFAIFHIDICSFGEFNRKYGAEAGDEVLREITAVLLQTQAKVANGIFIGHVGGDDFVLVANLNDTDRVIATLQTLLHCLRQSRYMKSIEERPLEELELAVKVLEIKAGSGSSLDW